MKRQIVSTDQVYKSRSHLSQAAVWGNLVWTGGLGPLNKEREIVSADMTGQARQCLENMKAVLAAAGTGFENVLKVNVYLRTMADFPAFEEVYKTYFKDAPPPPRCTVACELGHPPKDGRPGMLIEIEAVAGIPS